jgi:hypothetical protein
VRAATARKLSECGAEGVRKIQLQGVTASALFDSDTPHTSVWIVATKARRVLAGDVTSGAEPETPAKTHEPRIVVIGVFVLVEAKVVVVSFVASDEVNRVRIANEGGRCVEREPVAECARDRYQDARLMVNAQIVQPFLRARHGDRHGKRFPLP